jgi:hypothetical protein
MRLSKLFIIEIVLLFAQFWMGMTNNLFIIVPLNSPFNFFGYAGGVEVLAHIVNGSLILAIGLLIIYFSHKIKNSLVLRLTALAVVFAASAIASGTLFLEIFLIPSLQQVDDYFSMVMAISFLSVFTVFFTEIYVLKKVSIKNQDEFSQNTHDFRNKTT